MTDAVFARRERKGTVTARARVTVQLEIDADGAWSRDTTIAQVDTQALDHVEHKLRQAIEVLHKAGIGVRLVNVPRLVEMKFEADGREAEPTLW